MVVRPLVGINWRFRSRFSGTVRFTGHSFYDIMKKSNGGQLATHGELRALPVSRKGIP